MPKYGVSLLSGGLDSTTVTAYAKDQVDHISSITFHYGQTHSKEVDCAVWVAGIMGVEHELLDISFLSKVAWYSALTNPERFPMPTDRSDGEIGFGVPITYVSPQKHDISVPGRCLSRKQGVARHRNGGCRSRVGYCSLVYGPKRAGLQRVPGLPSGVLRGDEGCTGTGQQDLDRIPPPNRGDNSHYRPF